MKSVLSETISNLQTQLDRSHNELESYGNRLLEMNKTVSEKETSLSKALLAQTPLQHKLSRAEQAAALAESHCKELQSELEKRSSALQVG